MRAFGSLIRRLHHNTNPLISVSFVLWAIIAPVATVENTASAEQPTTPPAAATESAAPIVLRSRVFDIPFQVEGDSKASAVTLFVSADQGKTWQPAAKKPIPLSSFHYEADSDGEFWFAHTTDSALPQSHSPALSPELKILIDSAGPAIELSGEASLDGKLTGKLTLNDAHQVAALRILYATDVTRQWKTVANTSVDRSGNFVLDPNENWQRLSIHITAEDSLGHGSVEQKEFRRPRIAASRTNQYVDTPAKPRLQVRPAAGPSDPPSIRLGPSLGGSTNHSLQSPGSGPAYSNGGRSGQTNVPIHNRLRTPANSARPGNRFGSGFGITTPGVSGVSNQPQQQSPQPSSTQPAPNIPTPSMQSAASRQLGPQSRIDTQSRPATQSQPGVPRTLPASGVTATVTPEGIEVLPAPVHNQPASQNQPPAEATEELPKPQSPTPELNAPVSGNTTPSPSGPSPSGPSPSGPSPSGPSPSGPSASGLPASPNDPITKPAPVAPQAAAPQRRSPRDLLRPLDDSPVANAPGNQIRTNPLANGSQSTSTNTERYRADRAEQISREKQQLFDAAELSRNVPFRFSDSNRFSLEYELEAVGATGVESVELFGSLDGGKTWKRWGADPDRQSPFDIETKGEGVFSFRIVVLGNNGLASPRPLPGDTPDIAVIVDQTRPNIRITSAQYGEGNRTGSLVIRYECDDKYLTSRPLSLSFSDSLDGPWTTIAAGLRNDGLYVWPADPKLPPAIYIRVDATDKAGNKGTYVLDQPIATGGLAPRARILGFRSR